MKRLLALFAAVMALALLAPAAPAAAHSTMGSGNATAYVVHGIPGKDISPALDPSLPVDVSVNGGCALPGFTFGVITDGISLPAGDYTIAISLANAEKPCSNTPVIGPVTVPLAANTSYAIVAHLTAGGAPTASLFTLDTSRIRGGHARTIVHHTAAAPAVDICIVRGNGLKLTLENVKNGDQATSLVRPGRYYIDIAPAGSDTVVFGPVDVRFMRGKTYLVFAVGSLTNDTFTLLTKVI